VVFTTTVFRRFKSSNDFGSYPAPQLENIPWWGKNILREGGRSKRAFGGGQKYTKYKINDNSENFRGAFAPLVASLFISDILDKKSVSVVGLYKGVGRKNFQGWGSNAKRPKNSTTLIFFIRTRGSFFLLKI